MYKEYKDKASKHSYLRTHYGKPTYCSNKECNGKSKNYDWCSITGHKYTLNPKDYIWLCRSCHRKYDMTPQKKKQAIKNLWWKKGIKNPGKPNTQNLWFYKDKIKTNNYIKLNLK